MKQQFKIPTDWKCPNCQSIGGGIMFFVIHLTTCNIMVCDDEANRVIDIEFEQVNLLQ